MIKRRLEELGIILPEVPKPVASYIPAKIQENLLYISGQLPLKDGKLLLTGAPKRWKTFTNGSIKTRIRCRKRKKSDGTMFDQFLSSSIFCD